MVKLKRNLRFHGLRRPRIRQTWNKYNLYNLSRLRFPNLTQKTFFQQKWYAKALTRGYHGEHIQEGKWERMFGRRLNSVVNMRPTYMAAFDGSEQAAGRGSGLEEPPTKPGQEESRSQNPTSNVRNKAMTPYMQMTYAPQERRLDIAVFRALFASSARQARQMVVHGAVKVNGVKMQYPAYQLNPGDMFQVDPDHVMLATGLPKIPKSARKGSKPKAAKEGDQEESEEVSGDKEAEEAVAEAEETDKVDGDVKYFLRDIKDLHERVKDYLSDSKDTLSAKRKQQLRELGKQVKKQMAAAQRRKESELLPQAADDLQNLSTLFAQLEVETKGKGDATTQQETGSDSKQELYKPLTDREREKLQELIDEAHFNPEDDSKPYRTPWQPRPFMSAFAFIPRYLEVNQNICAAVYLRHPVARQGMAEVPTPFPPEISQLAFNWYLRRR